MASVVVCDICGDVMGEKSERYNFNMATDDGEVTMKLPEAMDICDECARKKYAKLARDAWDQVKATRKAKGEAK